MHFSINPTDSRPIYVQIMDEVRRGMASGALASGTPLPSVRQLAVSLKVNPNTVAQAYRELEREGLVYVQRGQGTFVGSARQIDDDRTALAHELAQRSLVEAARLGLNTEQFIQAIRSVDSSKAPLK
ncbi:GntR family transcriptional regulator [Brevundimonas sp. NPDC046655]|uniref:GntR family transcriptional regulator n=1 Tax=unclassified Brevundimonas TaxID=2622653 RepID=UPI00384E8393